MTTVQSLWGLVGAELMVFSLFWLIVRRVLRPAERGGLHALALFNLCMGVALVLIALRHRLPPLLTDSVADALVVLALALMWHGCAVHFSGKPAREPLAIAGVAAVLLVVGHWAWPQYDSKRVALVYLVAAWVVSRAAWSAVPVLRRHFDGAGAMFLLRAVAFVTTLWLTVMAGGGLLWGWELQLSEAVTSSFVTAYGVLIALTLVNATLYFVIVRSLVHELERLVSRDAMTGLLNRRAFWDRMDRRWQAWQASRVHFALISLDVDHFKSINDSCGHAAGDEVLRGVAAVLQAQARPRDDVARIGGEEFVVILDAVSDEDQALAAADRLRLAVEAMALPSALGPRRVTISAGVALVHAVDARPAATLARSDHALYSAKAGGRNCVTLHRPPPTA